MLPEKLTPQQVDLYHQQGYLIIKNFCSPLEINKLYNTAVDDNAMRNNAVDVNDKSGKKAVYRYGLRPATMFSAI